MSSQWPPPDGSPAPHSPGSAPSAAPDPGTFPPPRSAYEQPLQGQAYPPGPPPQWAPPPPRHLADQPPCPPPARGGGGAAWLGLVGVIGVVLVGLVVSFTPASLDGLLPGRTGQATTSPAPNADSSTKQPNDPGSGSSSSPTMPAKPEAVLKKNPIYALEVPANCPSQSAPSSRAAFRTQVKALLACENKVWRKALAGTAVTFSQPKVVFYGTRTSSPCGTLGDTYPAAYCTSNNTLYFATAAYAQGRYYRLAVAQFVMHEYAHHVQNLAGLFAALYPSFKASNMDVLEAIATE